MRRMIPQKLIDAIKHLAPLADTIEYVGSQVKINDDVAITGDISASGKLTGGPLSQFVKIMEAPESTTLSEDEIAIITEGVFINGNFLGFKNPILSPAISIGDAYYGIVIGTEGSGGVGYIQTYTINASKVINKQSNRLLINGPANAVQVPDSFAIKGKAWPTNPAVTGSFTLKCVNGTLTWVAD